MLLNQPNGNREDDEVVDILLGQFEPYCQLLLECRALLRVPEADLTEGEDFVYENYIYADFQDISFKCVQALADLYERVQ